MESTEAINKANIEKDENTASTLEKCYTNLMKNEKTTKTLLQQIGGDFKKIADSEANEKIKQIFNETSIGFGTIANEEQKHIDTLEKKIIPSIKAYKELAKDRKNDFSNLAKKKSDYLKKKGNLDTFLQSKKEDQNKKTQLEEACNAAKKTYDEGNDIFDLEQKNYSTERIVEFKALLQHMIGSQMQFHAKNIEILAELSKKIYLIDEDEYTKALIELLNTASYGHPNEKK